MSALHHAYRFTDGRLVKAEPPEWFTKAIVNSNDWPKSLSQAGATGIEKFNDGGESIYVFEGLEGDYFIGYWDAAKCFAEFFIDNVADYLKFRADYIAPFAKLTMKRKKAA